MNPPGTGPPAGPPAYGPPGTWPPPRRRSSGPIAGLVGLIVGLVIGAGGLGLAWTLSSGSSSGSEDELAAVCRLVLGTDAPTVDDTGGEVQRLWGVAELAAALAENDPAAEPLAEALDASAEARASFEFEEARTSLLRAQNICRD